MKTAINALVISVALLSASRADVITVSNSPNSPGQYTNLQTAINAASSGDTIYVHGSQTDYGQITITKRLILFGAGHKPDKDFPLPSRVGNITLDSVNHVSGASGTEIVGFHIASGFPAFSVAAWTIVNNVTIARCVLSSDVVTNTGYASGWVLTNNIIRGNVGVNGNSNWLISNNIFSPGYLSGSQQSTVTITNNVFHRDGGAGDYAFFGVEFATVTNNIFFRSHPDTGSVRFCLMNNNIMYQASGGSLPLPFGTNTGSGNLNGIDPQFSNVFGDNYFNYDKDYSLKPSSPGKNAGTDGTDIGVFGGGFPFVDMTGTPAIPQIKLFNIHNRAVSQGESLNIQFKAKVQD